MFFIMSLFKVNSDDREGLSRGFCKVTQLNPRFQDPKETCGYILDGSCAGVNNPETFREFCNAGNFAYKDCEIYKASSKRGEPVCPCEKAVDKNAETVIMSVDELISSSSCRGLGDLSVQDVIDNDGEYDSLGAIKSTFRRQPDDLRVV
jgi:hypothetical protein